MKTERRLRGSIVLATILLALGCADDPGPDATAQKLPPGHVPIGQSAAAPAAQEPLIVTITETMDSGGYTYARVDIDGSEAWVAGPVTQVEVGDVLMLSDAMPMENFTSNTLNRTFAVLYFVGEYQKQGDVQAPVARASTGNEGTVAQVLTGGGYTYVQVEVEGETLWLAGPGAAVSEGKSVSWTGGMTMTEFTSTRLNRTFAEILFVAGITVRE